MKITYEWTFVGACCLPDGTCDEMIEVECDALDGIWQGDTTSCDDPEVLCALGRIGDFIWLDENGDGMQGNGEVGIRDVEVILPVNADACLQGRLKETVRGIHQPELKVAVRHRHLKGGLHVGFVRELGIDPVRAGVK